MQPTQYPFAENRHTRSQADLRAMPNGYAILERYDSANLPPRRGEVERYDIMRAWFADLSPAKAFIRAGVANNVTCRSIVRTPDLAVIHLAKDLMGGRPYLIGTVAPG